MASPIVTGPVHIWLTAPPARTISFASNGSLFAGSGLGSPQEAARTATAAGAAAAMLAVLARAPQYLGTGKVGPAVRKRRHYAPVQNDLAGPAVPFDRVRAGMDALVSVTLTRHNPPVYRAIAGMSNTASLNGFETAADRGTLMITEGQAYGLILRYPFFDSHPAMRAAGMVPGYRFFAAMLDGDDDEHTGSVAQEINLVWYCGGVYDPRTNAWGLYDHAVLNVPALAPN